MNRADELEIMLRVAREASVVVARIYATNFSVDYKGPADPVTQAEYYQLAAFFNSIDEDGRAGRQANPYLS